MKPFLRILAATLLASSSLGATTAIGAARPIVRDEAARPLRPEAALKDTTSRGEGQAVEVRDASALRSDYGHLKDGTKVAKGAEFTWWQRKKIFDENRKRNGGVLRSDDPNDKFQDLRPAQMSRSGNAASRTTRWWTTSTRASLRRGRSSTGATAT